MNQENRKSILVVGGGISGLSCALESAEAGLRVHLIESEPFLGGRVSRSYQYFPKLCPPYCGLEINFQRLKKSPNITWHTQAEIESVSGGPGAYHVKIKLAPRYVNGNCTICGECEKVCPKERPHEINLGMSKTRAIYLPHELAFPSRHVIDRTACPGKECGKCVPVCAYKAIDLDMQPRTLEGEYGAIVLATGWRPYDAGKMDNLGFGAYPNVITNVMMERLAAPNGPTGGRIARPSDGKEVERIAFVQCAGSRDENHLPYCSAVCCSASLKQAMYLAEKKPDAQKIIFYIDIRTPGRLEDFYTKAREDKNLRLLKGKVAKVTEDPATHDLTVEAENTETGKKMTEKVDMVVLATGIVPNTSAFKGLPGLAVDENGFVAAQGAGKGIFGVGCARRPSDVSHCVQDSTGVALKAMQAARGERL